MAKLPSSQSLSSSAFLFLDDRIKTREDVCSGALSLTLELQSECIDLERKATDLESRLGSCISSYYSSHDRVQSSLDYLCSSLTNLYSLTCPQSSIDGLDKQQLREKLPELAREVARVDAVRSYAEAVLKLDKIVGDVEDAVSSFVNKSVKKQPSSHISEGTRYNVVDALERVEGELTSISETRPQWRSLVAAVDQRIDRALAMLRPQAIAEHRNFLVSLGWPPPLVTLAAADHGSGNSSDGLNPLFSIRGDLKDQYYQNIIALCRLQAFQIRRKSCHLGGRFREVALHEPLWIIEELVNPLFICCQKKFLKWKEKPEFVFALVLKIARDYVDNMDELLQPVVDEARLLGYSCREEWVSAVTTSLSAYLVKEIFPNYIEELNGEELASVGSRIDSFIQLIDLMMSFDQQIKSLIAQSGIGFSLQEDSDSQKISSLSIFCDRSDWADLWAKVEVTESLKKIQFVIADENNWAAKIKQESRMSELEHFKSPAVTGLCIHSLFSVVDRCKLLPSNPLRLRYFRLVGIPIVRTFLDSLLLRCQEAEGLTALTDDENIIKVVNSINSAHYFESVLKKRCDDIFFLELSSGFQSEDSSRKNDEINCGMLTDDTSKLVFSDEIQILEKFREEWVEKLSVVVLRGFDARSREYVKNRKQWQDQSERGWRVSPSLVESLDYLQGKITVFREHMNELDFIVVWRSLASSIDRLFFTGILASSVKFSDVGVERFCCDLGALFGIFGVLCMRPESFFPKLRDSLKVLRTSHTELKTTSLMEVGRWIRESGIGNLNVSEVEKLLKCKVHST